MTEQTRNPSSDDAVAGTWTGSAGSRWSASSLTHGTTAGNLTFGYSAFSVPAGATDIAVHVDYLDFKNGSQSCNIGGRLKIGGTYHNASTHNPGNGIGNQTARTDTFSTNPKTGSAWTVADVNGSGSNPLQAFGWVSTDASPTVTLASAQLRVTYTEPLQDRTGAGSTTTQPATSGGAGAVAIYGAGSTIAQPAVTGGAGTVSEPMPERTGAGATVAQSSTSSGAGSAPVAGAGASVAAASTTGGAGAARVSGSGATVAQQSVTGGAGVVTDEPPEEPEMPCCPQRGGVAPRIGI